MDMILYEKNIPRNVKALAIKATERDVYTRRGYIVPVNNKKPTKLIGHDDQYHYYAYKFVTTNTEEIIFTVPSEA